MSQAVHDYVKLAARCHVDPGWFDREVLGHTLTSDIIELKRALRRSARNYEREPNRIMAVSAHGVGKSFALAAIVCEAMLVPHAIAPDLPDNPGVRVLVLGQTGQQAADVVWREVQKMAARAKEYLGTAMPMTREWRIGVNRTAYVFSPEGPEAAQGRHDDLQILVVDEANTFREDLWPALNSLLSGGRSFMICTLNPIVPAGYLYRMTRRKDLWQVLGISAMTHPNVIEGREVIPGAVTRKYVRDLVSERFEECSTDPAITSWETLSAKIASKEWVDEVVKSRVLGQFHRHATDTFVTLASLEDVMPLIPDLVPAPGVLGHIGVDVGVTSDQSIFTYIAPVRHPDDKPNRVRWMKSDEKEIDQGRGPEVAAKLIEWAKGHGIEKSHAHHIHIDKIGVGASVCDQMILLGWQIDEVDSGGGLQFDHMELTGQDPQILNRRAELWYVAGEMSRKGDLIIPERFDRTIDEVTIVKRVADRIRNRIQAEPKIDVKKRLGRSPDRGDSLVMSLSRVGSGGGVSTMVIPFEIF